MRPYRVGRWLCALMLTACGTTPVQAAWDNVFQVCCHNCNSRPLISRFYSARCCPAPTCCTTQYVQRSYYQPVTCYQAQSYYEPVTAYRTSYYYEPVTSYRYSCYYDPCTCSYQQVACPQTCYRLRSQTCAVTSYLLRTCQVPVTSYQLSYYYEPVTSCYAPSACCSPCSNGYGAPAVAEPYTAPGVYEQRSAPPAAGVQEQRTTPAPPPASPGKDGAYDRYYPTPANPSNPAPAPGNSTYRQVPPTAPNYSPPTVKLDRIVSLSKAAPGELAGQVVDTDNASRGGVQLMFVSATQDEKPLPATADAGGRFNVNLKPGSWLVYMVGADGKPVFHSRIEVRDQNRPVILVSR